MYVCVGLKLSGLFFLPAQCPTATGLRVEEGSQSG